MGPSQGLNVLICKTGADRPSEGGWAIEMWGPAPGLHTTTQHVATVKAFMSAFAKWEATHLRPTELHGLCSVPILGSNSISDSLVACLGTWQPL